MSLIVLQSLKVGTEDEIVMNLRSLDTILDECCDQRDLALLIVLLQIIIDLGMLPVLFYVRTSMVRQCPLFIAGCTEAVFGTYPPRGSIPHRLLSDLW